MRYHKSFQLVATFVASAGAFVVLQGTARADTPSTIPAQQSTAVPDGSAVVAPGANPSIQHNTVPTDSTERASRAHDGTLTPGGDASNPTKVKPDDSATVPAAGDGQTQEDINAPTGASTDNTSLPVMVTMTVPPVTPDSSESAQERAVITLTDQFKPTSSVRPAIILRIQPTIRSYATADVGDLAWSLPSVPVAAKQPVPAKTNGALGKLRLLLAGVVVPNMFGLTDWAVLHGLILVLGTLGGLLLGSLYAFSYGLWLKRAGFVNAARSDAPNALATSSLFATPQLLGYVTMPPRRHSPIFVVADIKFPINEFLFPTLSERRTYK